VNHSPAAALAARIDAVSAAYLGTPYALDPLGEGEGVDPDPLLDRTRVDCVTFVEQVLAEAIATNANALLPALNRIRYRNGSVGYLHRNHYFVADWISNNRWLVADATQAIGRRAVRTMTKTIDRAALFRAHGCSPEECRVAPQRLTTAYIPRAAVAGVLSRIPPVAIAVFVQDRPGVDTAHIGILLAARGRVLLRHASQRRKKVVEEPLLEFLTAAPRRVIGLKICSIRAARPK
jgi:hypothetical protein